ncbi:MAG: hypothetical protein IJA89_03270 [Clostridia bacterium]|nr:hypothetical protein [Clostridia bacterium]
MIPYEVQQQMRERLKQRPDIKKMRIARKCCLITDVVVTAIFFLSYMMSAFLLIGDNASEAIEQSGDYSLVITVFVVLAMFVWVGAGIAIFVLNNLITRRMNRALYEWVSNADPQVIANRETEKEVNALFTAPTVVAPQAQPQVQPFAQPKPPIQPMQESTYSQANGRNVSSLLTPVIEEQRRKMLSTVYVLRGLKVFNAIMMMTVGFLLLFLPLVSFLGFMEISIWDMIKEFYRAMQSSNSAKATETTLLGMLINWDTTENKLGSIGLFFMIGMSFTMILIGLRDVIRVLISILSQKAERKIGAYYGGVVYYDDKDESYVKILKSLEGDNYIPVTIIGFLIWVVVSLGGPILYLRYMQANLFEVETGLVVVCGLVWLLQTIFTYVAWLFQIRRKEEVKMLLPMLGKDFLRIR